MAVNRCPTWPEIYASQVYEVIETGDTREKLLGKVVATYSDLWKPTDGPLLDRTLRRLSAQHLISYNRKAQAWVRT